MFSQGQLVFAGLFFVAFVIAAIYSYRKDIKIHKQFYKGNYKILIGFGIFIGILFLIKVFFKR
jgi:cytochrome bd-type quinol oxidase subunit 1